MRRPTKRLASIALTRPRRGAFTLIEIMIVIVIIAILIALLLPAVRMVFGTARTAQVQMEIKSIEQAIAAFKVQFGIEPPSSITLCERGTDMNAADQAVIRRLWPRFNFAAYQIELNGNNMQDANVSATLRGAECLVFFLGGRRAVDPVSGALLPGVTGFSKNPALPFAPQSGGSETRDGPFFEFKSDRLVESNNATAFLVYIDPLPGHSAPHTPYFYVSSNDGRGYNPADLTNGAGGTRLADVYCLASEDKNADRLLQMPEDANGNGRLDIVYINPKTFQIVSPGVDRTYGLGGVYLKDKPNGGLMNRSDYDNITNFQSGVLKP